MKRNLNALILFLLLISVGIFLYQYTQLSGESRRPARSLSAEAKIDFTKRTEEIFSKVNDFYRANGFDSLVSLDNLSSPIIRKERGISGEKRLSFLLRDRRAMIAISFTESTGLPSIFQNGYAEYAAHSIKEPFYIKPPKPNWSKRKAISMAKEFLRVIRPDLDYGVLQFSLAEFNWSAMEDSKYCEGEWYVAWKRCSKEGYQYQFDNVNVSISEKYGPKGCGINLGTDCILPKKEIISKEKANANAKAFIETEIKKGKAKGFKIIQHLFSELKVINSSTFKPWDGVPKLKPNEARLAWSVRYEYEKDMGNYKIGGWMEFWVDAETEIVLGCNSCSMATPTKDTAPASAPGGAGSGR